MIGFNFSMSDFGVILSKPKGFYEGLQHISFVVLRFSIAVNTHGEMLYESVLRFPIAYYVLKVVVLRFPIAVNTHGETLYNIVLRFPIAYYVFKAFKNKLSLKRI